MISFSHSKLDLIELIGHNEPQFLSDISLPTFVRQLAIHANVSCYVKGISFVFQIAVICISFLSTFS